MVNMRTVVIAAASVGLVGCYHARIETELAPSTVTIEEPFASSWIFGLVPPKLVETAEKCPDGVAMVETRQSFVNGLVAVITLGIYTPIEIKVTCAMGSMASDADVEPDVILGEDATQEEWERALSEAVELATERRAPVYVKL